MAGVLKKTTRLTGLTVLKYPHRDLLTSYNKILRLLDTLPKTYPYRQHTETLIKERQQIVKENTDVSTVEEKIGCGQVEELLIQARNEIRLLEKMQTWKPWENLIEPAPEYQWTWPPHK